MKKDYIIAVSVCFGILGVLAIGFSLPPLTGSRASSSVSERQQAAVAKESAYCRANMDDVNCACFAQKAGQVMAHDSPRVGLMQYVDRTDLARNQARGAC